MARDRLELRREAELLYVEGDASVKEIAELLKVPQRTMGRWCTIGGWVKKRHTRGERLADISASLNRLRDSMLAHALETLDHKDVTAALKIDKEVREREGMKKSEPALFLTFLKTLTEILKDEDPSAVKVLNDNYDAIIRGFRERSKA